MAIIYHYCSPETFQKIIENKTLWLSATNNMNDFAEGKWVENALGRVLNKIVNEGNKEWCDELWNTVISNNQPTYVACFSKDGDSLSQWRAYAQDGEGLAIGFDEDKLGIGTGMPVWHASDINHSIKLNEINYIDVHELEREISSFINSNRDTYNTVNIFDLSLKISNLAITVKNPAFEEEKEKRIIYKALIVIDGNKETKENFPLLGNVMHRVSNGYLTSYFNFFFKPDAIKEIVLGPKNKFYRDDTSLFLKINKLDSVVIHKSTATYR
ncbi:DUF2971 domain-containing protein [Pectobacterium versatile]|uniref:DUF2971 domain-containing protein n=1 Tax=Pectobacterium versatile TaxID=2488639 RepID=UPI001CD09BBA|nr:DUF2971 domain-containing protein [Pectobacterium versatile]GKV79975.1 hypothetical protein PEC106664_07490 [Pectobacterium carotovorum subsp. carotovorum]GKW34258.1 hypothetical protein PEC730217_30380 [Pectobacterium carotovorum subsp. carotovorum]